MSHAYHKNIVLPLQTMTHVWKLELFKGSNNMTIKTAESTFTNQTRLFSLENWFWRENHIVHLLRHSTPFLAIFILSLYKRTPLKLSWNCAMLTLIPYNESIFLAFFVRPIQTKDRSMISQVLNKHFSKFVLCHSSAISV